ncbi:DUF6151 family protein [Candidatus Haliotispira prima]|uniref:DUF6151 family protein n=1 Tax=Candidatus Haliotispira prima TaxID=3034016 RepID=A0ABY8MH08_9SPIO|nr:DUF6151 family protein [Candidatus Haliotispira prima]
MAEVRLKCSCGIVQGVAHDISPNSGTRLVCYCDDCQAFARFLKREDVTDAHGGTDIFQTTHSRIQITDGAEQLRCLKLRPKGLFRWYTECCKTPIANTVSSGVPFVGMIHNFMDDDGVRDSVLGPVRGYIQGKFAKETLPAKWRGARFPLRIVMRSLCKLLAWKVQGLHKPSPFFDASGNPVGKLCILDSDVNRPQSPSA